MKVYIDNDGEDPFLADIRHAILDCIACHGGQSGENTKDDAHVSVNPDPSEGIGNKCVDGCHANKFDNFPNSIHATQAGYKDLFETRSGLDFESHPGAMAGFQMDCAGCHTSCGDCHISSPKNVGGGLVAGHRFNETPDQDLNCTACHGSRINDEYKGSNEYPGVGADVHWVPNFFRCTECHTAEEMHGDETTPKHRYEVTSMPQCDDSGCHAGLESANEFHSTHMEDMACQVCHSQTYKSCNGCHVGEGITGNSYPTFKIGKNPIPQLRDKEYVLLRHIPIAEDTYTGWGVTDLPNFAAVPTWKYTSPHNIRMWTARTDTSGGRECYEACHDTEDGTDGFFLRAADLEGLSAAEQQANQGLIVPDGNPFGWQP